MRTVKAQRSCTQLRLSFPLGHLLGISLKEISQLVSINKFYYLTFGCEGIKSIQVCCCDEDWQYYDHTMTSC